MSTVLNDSSNCLFMFSKIPKFASYVFTSSIKNLFKGLGNR
jgi:hypothetical protein